MNEQSSPLLDDNRETYQPPTVEVVEVLLEEVLADNCKVGGPGCASLALGS